MSGEPFHPSVLLRFSAQKALLGAVPPSLRLVSGRAIEPQLVLSFVFNGPIEDDDVESLRVATTEMIADFPSPWTLVEYFIRLDCPSGLDDYAYEERLYERKEGTSEGSPLS